MTEILPCLWFDRDAEAAARFYVSLLPGSRIESVLRYSTETPGGSPGGVMSVEFTLAGRRYMALNGGPRFQFTPAVSFYIDCKDQAEVDRLWEALAEGGATGQCGWLKDRYGASWQIVPSVLREMLKDPSTLRVRRLTQAILGMTKLDVDRLRRAFDGETTT